MAGGENSGGRRIRRFVGSDLNAIAAIQEKSQEAAQWNAAALGSLGTPGNPCWVIEENAQVVGFMAVRVVGGEAEILNLAVQDSHRRHGCANALLQQALSELGGEEVSEVYLEVRESNAAALALYERHDFAKFGVRPGYYREPAEAAICMKKILTG